MHALLKTLLPCGMIIVFGSCTTLQAAPSVVVLEQHSQLQLAQSQAPRTSRRPVAATGGVPLPSRRPATETKAGGEDLVAPPTVGAVSSGDAPQTIATEPDLSTKTPDPATWDACIAEAKLLQRAPRQQKIQACTEVLAQLPAGSGPRRKEALKQRALAHAIDQRSLAIADYSTMLEADSSDVESLLARGALHLKEAGFGGDRGRYDLAMADFNRAIALDPRNTQALIQRGDAHRATLGHSRAAQDYRLALEIDPASAAARVRLDSSQQDLQPQKQKNQDYEACLRSPDPDTRMEACTKFISTTPKFYNSSSRMLIASKGDSFDKSMDSFSLATDIDTGMTERGYAFAFRALAHYQKKDVESALVDLNHAIDRAPILIRRSGEASTRDRILLRRGEVYMETKEYDRAEADFRAVLKVNFVADGHANLAVLYFFQDQHDRALSEIALLLKRDPKNAVGFSVRGRILLKRQQYQRALQDCQQAVELTKAPDRAPNAERCVEAARQALAQTTSNAPPSSGKSE